MPRELLDARYINEPEMFARFYGDGKGLKGCPPPIWQVKGKARRYPDFWVHGYFYVLSSRLKSMLDEHAPGAIEALPLRIETLEGNLVRDDYWVADVTLSIKGIDWANSIVAYQHLLGGISAQPLNIVMRDEALGLAMFRDVNRSGVFIHRNLYEILANAKPKVTGTYFTEVW
ncbi:hypothetical protein SAMIE_1033020 [Sphingobium amiense]|uniref:Immunity MXAN-0049 protein domain-containing protein n=2 Tax=Sphingobium amiense TaxID=135719 RepID=A0A494W6C6_9SPHN|nr:hypothetical protein SAMIE_1033020 [Sphingobium amiense]